MKRILFAAALAASIFNSNYSFAQAATPRINHRQAHQQTRIRHGVASGQLTPRETGRLQAREAKLQQDKLAAKSDGKVTYRERNHLRREENRDSRAIYRQKHDAQAIH